VRTIIVVALLLVASLLGTAVKASAQVWVEDVPKVRAQEVDSRLAEADNLLLSAQSADVDTGNQNIDDARAVLLAVSSDARFVTQMAVEAAAFAQTARSQDGDERFTSLSDARAHVEFARALLKLQ